MLRRARLARRSLAVTATLSLVLACAPAAWAHTEPAVSADSHPGQIKLHVDATDTAHRVFSIREEIPVKAGPLRLYYPQWLPGNHAPRGPIDLIGGLRFSANGQPLPWRRDSLDVYSFLVDVPEGATTLLAEFQYLTPMDREQGRVVMTPQIIGLQWNAVLLYPAGYDASRIMIAPSVTLNSALRPGKSNFANA